MSDEPKPLPTGATPVPTPQPPASPTAPLPAEAKLSAGQTPGLPQQTTAKPPAPVIEYAMPAHKSSWLPSPALIKNLGCLIKLTFGLTVLLLMGYFALVALNPKARQWALQGTKPGPGGAPPSGKGPTPFKIVNQVLAIPAQALGKTDDVVKANNSRAGLVDNLVAEEEAKTKGGQPGRTFAPVTDPFATPAAADKKPGSSAAAAGTASEESAESQAVSRAAILALAEKNAATVPPPALDTPPPKPVVVTPPAPDSPEQIKLAGNIIISHASPAGAPRAGAAFFFWVVNLNVSGITQGSRARLLINNRLAYEGDVVNRSLGITFAQLDAANQLLVFRDATGATVTRSY